MALILCLSPATASKPWYDHLNPTKKEYNAEEIALINQSLSKDPDNIILLNEQMLAYTSIGRYQRARDILKKIS